MMRLFGHRAVARARFAAPAVREMTHYPVKRLIGVKTTAYKNEGVRTSPFRCLAGVCRDIFRAFSHLGQCGARSLVRENPDAKKCVRCAREGKKTRLSWRRTESLGDISAPRGRPMPELEHRPSFPLRRLNQLAKLVRRLWVPEALAQLSFSKRRLSSGAEISTKSLFFPSSCRTRTIPWHSRSHARRLDRRLSRLEMGPLSCVFHGALQETREPTPWLLSHALVRFVAFLTTTLDRVRLEYEKTPRRHTTRAKENTAMDARPFFEDGLLPQ